MKLIVDASNIIHRSYWIANKGIEEDHGSNLHAYLFLKSLKSYCDKVKPTDIYCVWDKNLEENAICFRNELAPDTYKANRDEARSKEVYTDFAVIESLVKAVGGYNVFPYKMEGDDVITFLCKYLEGPKTIVSADKDMLQLISDQVSVYNVNKKKIINPANFEAEYEIPLVHFVEYKCLIGDPADNIPRVLTPAKAKKIIDKRSTLTEEQKIHYNLNFKLIDLDSAHAQQPGEWDKMVDQVDSLTKQGSYPQFIKLCREYKMNSIVNYSDDWRQTFFARNSLSNIINLLNRPK